MVGFSCWQMKLDPNYNQKKTPKRVFHPPVDGCSELIRPISSDGNQAILLIQNKRLSENDGATTGRGDCGYHDEAFL